MEVNSLPRNVKRFIEFRYFATDSIYTMAKLCTTIPLFLCLLVLTLGAFGQSNLDSLVFINGKVIGVSNARLINERVEYSIGANTKKVNIDRLYSILHTDGREEILYQKDTLDANDFSIEEMRMFIKGERDAKENYHNNVNKVASAAVGVGSSMLQIYGLVIPAAYATFVAGITPNIEKHKVSNPDLISNPAFREGYESYARRSKIKNSLIYGFAGFAAGFAAYTIFLHD